MKYTADELANKLEQKARALRENGLAPEDMELVSGGHCHCCGSTCSFSTGKCDVLGPDDQNHPEGCKYNCIGSSPD